MLVAIPPISAAVVFDPLGVEMGTLFVVAGAALVAYGLLAHDLAVIEVAMVVWLAALMILVNHRLELTLHAAVVIVSVTLLGIVKVPSTTITPYSDVQLASSERVPVMTRRQVAVYRSATASPRIASPS